METNNQPVKTLPVLILNVSPDADLRIVRAKILNDSGYFTSSAETGERALKLAGRMNCDLAILCHSFTAVERQAISDRLHETSPAMRILLLDETEDADANIFLNMVKKALRKLEIVADEKTA